MLLGAALTLLGVVAGAPVHAQPPPPNVPKGAKRLRLVPPGRRAAPKRPALHLQAPRDQTDRLSAADLAALEKRLAAGFAPRFRVLVPCKDARCQPRSGRIIVRILDASIVTKAASAGLRCQLELLLLAPPLLPRRARSKPLTCDRKTLLVAIDAAVKQVLPKAGGQAEAEPPRVSVAGGGQKLRVGGEIPTGTKPAEMAPKQRVRAQQQQRARRRPPPPAASQPALPRFRDRAKMAFGMLLVGRRLTFETAAVDTADRAVVAGLRATIEIYPGANWVDSALADVGLDLRYARTLGDNAAGTVELEWLEVGLRWRWNLRRELGGPELAAALGYGTQSSFIGLNSGDSLRLHALQLRLAAWLPFVRRRDWWIGAGSEVTGMLVLPSKDIAKTSAGIAGSLGLVFSYQGLGVRLELLTRAFSVDTTGRGFGTTNLSEWDLAAALAVSYAL